MTEDTLKHLSINEILTLLSQSMNDLRAAKNQNDRTALMDKTEDVELLKKILITKRAEFRPL